MTLNQRLSAINPRKLIMNQRPSAINPRRSATSEGGFSLVELLIYIAILAAVSGIAVGVLTTITKTQVQESTLTDVSGQIGFITQTIQRLVRDSSLIDMTAGNATTTLKLRMPNLVNDPTLVYLSNGQIYVQQGTNPAQTITGSSVNVDSLQFTKLSQAPGKDTVQIDIAVSAVQKASGTTISRALRTAVARVNAATFDSDLLPNTDNAYNVGSNPSSRWLNGAFSGNLTTGGNVGIGTTNLDAVLNLKNNVYTPPLGSSYSQYGITLYRGSTPAGTYGMGVESYYIGFNSNGGYKFYQQASSNPIMVIGGQGSTNVGIGTAAPAQKLEVDGNIYVKSTTPTIEIDRMGAWSTPSYLQFDSNSSSSIAWTMGMQGNSTNNFYLMEGGTTSQLSVLTGGNVGIGTSTPGEKLEVDGTDTTIRVRNTNDSVGGFIGNTWASLQLGMYNPSASTVGVLAAGSKMSFLGINTSGAVGSLTNSYGSPVFRNQLDDGSGNIILSGGRIEGVGTPTASTDAATKGYVDAAAGGGSLSVYQSDGVTLVGKYLGLDPVSALPNYVGTGTSTPVGCDKVVYSNSSNQYTAMKNGDCTSSLSGASAHYIYYTSGNCTGTPYTGYCNTMFYNNGQWFTAGSTSSYLTANSSIPNTGGVCNNNITPLAGYFCTITLNYTRVCGVGTNPCVIK